MPSFDLQSDYMVFNVIVTVDLPKHNGFLIQELKFSISHNTRQKFI